MAQSRKISVEEVTFLKALWKAVGCTGYVPKSFAEYYDTDAYERLNTAFPIKGCWGKLTLSSSKLPVIAAMCTGLRMTVLDEISGYGAVPTMVLLDNSFQVTRMVLVSVMRGIVPSCTAITHPGGWTAWVLKPDEQ